MTKERKLMKIVEAIYKWDALFEAFLILATSRDKASSRRW